MHRGGTAGRLYFNRLRRKRKTRTVDQGYCLVTRSSSEGCFYFPERGPQQDRQAERGLPDSRRIKRR
ncbi:hypothetical protein chiPu_0003869 [Chiloscyllium punctatum]|uniref:Uncharacterized protein n=1 Tax=Chiloscyllium punctatum TaxID=137246 RepID=A0A401S539_CHIPU|nr:hypothetical protein [Chiloscyllium punctatum]